MINVRCIAANDQPFEQYVHWIDDVDDNRWYYNMGDKTDDNISKCK